MVDTFFIQYLKKKNTLLKYKISSIRVDRFGYLPIYGNQ